MSLEREIEIASRLAREAGALILELREGIAVEMKPGDEPVTAADRRASELLVKGLSEAFPGDVVISEESEDDLRRLGADRVWYIDPIDGTKDYIAARPGFAVMIGLTVGHVPTLGVVYAPLGDRLFRAAPDEHGMPVAWMDAPDAPPRRLAVSDVGDVSHLRLVASASNRTAAIDQVKSALGIADEWNVGSVGLKLALISLAERDLYVNPSAKSKLWDVCAPEAILRAAGGVLTDARGGVIRYDTEDLACRQGLVASNGKVHEAVLAKLAALWPAS